MSYWIAKDRDGRIFLYSERPIKREDFGIFTARTSKCDIVALPNDDSTMDLTFDNSPQKLIISKFNTDL